MSQFLQQHFCRLLCIWHLLFCISIENGEISIKEVFACVQLLHHRLLRHILPAEVDVKIEGQCVTSCGYVLPATLTSFLLTRQRNFKGGLSKYLGYIYFLLVEVTRN